MQQLYTTGKNLTLLFVLSLWVSNALAQPNITWQRSYGTPADDYATKLFADPNGNIIVIGSEVHQDFTGLFRPYMVIAKVDRQGNEIWKKYHDVAFNTFNPPVDYTIGKQFYTEEWDEVLINLVVTMNNRTMMYKILDGTGDYYYAEDIPSPTIDIAADNEKVYAYELCSSAISCYGPDSLVMEWFDPSPDSFIFNPIVWTFEMRQNLRTAPIQGHYDFDVQDLRHDSAGNVYLLVQIERWDFQFCTDCAAAFIDAWNEVFKVSPEGELISHKRIDVTTAVVSSMGFVRFDNGEMIIRIDDINAAGTDLLTTLYNVNEDLEVEDAVSLGKQYQFVQVTDENEFVALSNSFDPNDPLSLGLTDMILSRLDADGGLIWSKRIGGAGYDFSKGLLAFEDDIVVLANTDSDDHDIAENNGFTDIWLANFSMEPLSNENVTTVHALNAYPNPATDKLFLLGDADLASISFFDITGRSLFHQANISLASGIAIETIPAGLYVVKAIDVHGKLYSGKVVIE
jgi:hypothetical protein